MPGDSPVWPERYKRSGSLSLEAALALPSVLLVIGFFLTAIWHEQRRLVVTQAVDRVAAELSLVLPVQSALADALPLDQLLADGLADWDGPRELLTKALDLGGEALLEVALAERIQQELADGAGPLAAVGLSRQHARLTVNLEPVSGRAFRWLVCTYQSPLLGIRVETQVRAVIPLWAAADKASADQAASQADEVWLLDNFQRGQTIRKLLKANLPADFPVIASWSEGEATLIHSIDLTAPTYQDPREIVAALNDKIEKLAAFQGTTYQREGESITIQAAEIDRRTLLLVVPGNYDRQHCDPSLSELKVWAAGQGVKLLVQQLGTSRRYLAESSA